MKKFAQVLAVAAIIASPAFAADLEIGRVPLGSGTPGLSGFETGVKVGENPFYHAPQYLPGYPTAATIWPRVIEVDCKGSKCEGYEWSPKFGRGEYLFVVPVVEVVLPKPVPRVETQTAPVPRPECCKKPRE